ncbi:hypothetical protein [Spirochaeta thermophila]|nr:hypothetical protein [Spirochaeta thermophila]
MMKALRIFGVALIVACAGGILAAQQVMFHGYADYSNYLLTTYATQTGSEDWEQFEYGAGFGSWYGGRTEVNMFMDSQNIHFVLGIRLGNDLDTWYDLYGDDVPFYQGNVRINLLNNQVDLLTGKFEEQHFGYVTNDLAWGFIYAHNVADRDVGPYFTGLEIKPYMLDGFSLLVGVPIRAWSTNDGWGSMPANNYWQNLVDQFKINMRYSLPMGVTLKAGYYHGLWYSASDYKGDDDVVREAYLSAEGFNFLGSGFDLAAGYDFQYRTATEGMKHNINVSGAYRPISSLRIALGNRFAYATEFHDNAQEILLDRVVLDALYDLPLPGVQVGLRGNFTYMSDSSGQVGNMMSGDSDDLGFSTNIDAAYVPANPTDGTSGMAMGGGVFPFIKKNLSNGYVQLGYQMHINYYESKTSVKAISHYVPLNVAFWF